MSKNGVARDLQKFLKAEHLSSFIEELALHHQGSFLQGYSDCLRCIEELLKKDEESFLSEETHAALNELRAQITSEVVKWSCGCDGDDE